MKFFSTHSRSSLAAAISATKIWAVERFGRRPVIERPINSQPPHRRRLDPASLQFRLTVGVTAFSIVGLGGLAMWASWKMQQILVDSHTQNVEYVVERFPQDVELYRDMFPLETSIQKTVDLLSPPNLLIWVKDTEGRILAESETLNTASPVLMKETRAIAIMPIEPQVYALSDHYLILCSSPLEVKGQAVGHLYIAQDITGEQTQLNGAIRGLRIVTCFAIVLLAMAITIYIRRSLQPLRQISQLTGMISADDLNQSTYKNQRQQRLCLEQAPSEVKELAETLDDMLSRLADSWDQQRQFISNISHELRTPLTVVYGYLQSLLRRSQGLTPPQQEALEIAVSETDRTIRLLQDLLELARADSGTIHFRMEPIVLNELALEIARMGERFSNRTIQIEANADDIWVKADRDYLTQALINLMDNAVKYSNPERPLILKLMQTPEQTTIQVIDQGCGIPLQHQARIFERFYRVDDDRCRTTGGVGLGLAIVKSLVEGMGGHVTVASQLGAGSTFTLAFPTPAE